MNSFIRGGVDNDTTLQDIVKSWQSTYKVDKMFIVGGTLLGSKDITDHVQEFA